MNAQERRKHLEQRLSEENRPLSATSLAREFGVSRQVIVGDIALLRAKGCPVIATARGYMLSHLMHGSDYIGKIVSAHALDDTRLELETIIDLGGEVIDVTVEHYLYGEITGRLNIATQDDIEDFMQRVKNNKARLLSELTSGVHIHTIACRGADIFGAIKEELSDKGLLYIQEKTS